MQAGLMFFKLQDLQVHFTVGFVPVNKSYFVLKSECRLEVVLVPGTSRKCLKFHCLGVSLEKTKVVTVGNNEYVESLGELA
jgi:hypothetical protein